MYAATLAARFLVPLRNEGDPNTEPGIPLRVVVFHNERGEDLPVFTDWEAAWLWPGNVRAASFAVVSGPGLFKMARKLDAARVLINPHGPLGLEINKAAIAMLAEGRVA